MFSHDLVDWNPPVAYPDPVLEPPFLPPLVTATDPQFPVRITERAKRNLFWHIVNSPSYSGPGVLFRLEGARQVPWFAFSDMGSLDPKTHRLSHFGRVPIAVSLDEEAAFEGQVFDCNSFPPGPRVYSLVERNKQGLVEYPDPGQFRLSLSKLQDLHPELFRPPTALTRILTRVFSVTSMLGSQPNDSSWIRRWVGPCDTEGQAQAIEGIAGVLWYYPKHAAVVLKEDPFIVSVYIPPLDNALLLRLPQHLQKQGPRGRAWLVGDRMISCSTCYWFDGPSGDIPLGPKADWFSNECWPVLADFLTEDLAALEKQRATISAENWTQAREMGRKRLEQGAPIRDGRPWYSRIGVQYQKRSDCRVPGGYLG